MAQYKFTAALNASVFPLISRLQPRSVIIGQLDGRLRDPSKVYQDTSDNNPTNVPQVIYCENVMPTVRGMKSVSAVNLQPAKPGAGTVDDVYVIRDGSGASWFFMPAQGMNYVTPILGTPWVSTNPLAGAPLVGPHIPVSVAEVNGITYVCYFGTKLLQWNGVNFVDCAGTLLGIAVGSIRSICSAGNYLVVCYSDSSVKWSSLTNPLDFVPSVSTGAGSQIPIDIRGIALYLSQITGGFLIHCSENVVAAVYTQNVAQPWIFREIKNSGGIEFEDYHSGVSRQTSTSSIYQYGQVGLQQLDLREALNIHPQVVDFFADKLVETFNPVTNLLSLAAVAVNRYNVKVAFLNSRYLCLSYGSTVLNNYTAALIFDSVLKRWGKLNITHACIFNNNDATTSSDAIFILRLDGSCDQLILDDRAQGDAAVLILGRYQISRSHNICSEELELEVQDFQETPDVWVISNANGATAAASQQMVLFENTDLYRRYQKQVEAGSLSYVIKGTFNLSTVLLTVTKGALSSS